MALLLLARAWAQDHGHDLHAVTIDHGLRPEAAAEAAFVASVCARLGVDHTTLGWHDGKPESGLQEAAREMRYRKLEAYAAAIGSDAILVGHTADDQAETVAMRLARATGQSHEGAAMTRGAAGMDRQVRLPGGINLFRPLLGLSRRQLRNYLGDVGQTWIEDPSNQDRSYERVRVRQALAGEGTRKRRLLQLAEVAGRLRGLLARDAARLLDDAVQATEGPVLAMDVARARQAPRAVLVLAIQALIAAVGGGRWMPPALAVGSIVRQVGKRFRMTLGGAVIESDGQNMRFLRERRNLDRRYLAPGVVTIWDGRVEIENRSQQHFLLGSPETKPSRRDFANRREAVSRHSLAALGAAPVLSDGRRRYYVLECFYEEAGRIETGAPPEGVRVRRVVPAIQHFCPETDMALHDWAARLDLRTRLRPTPEAGLGADF